ncbi:MAG: phytanoyl-CoA dioxygenase family protein, partial [Acidimicrobiia bacterium]|nr:phytanoyl-CoA dioxygenase family protein [Acidimicrobiia bacterium]
MGPRLEVWLDDVGDDILVDVAVSRFSPDTDPAVVSAHLLRHGYAIVENLVGDETMDALAAEVEPYVSRSAHGRDHYDGVHTRRTGALVARCPTARTLIMHPTVLGVVDDFLGHATTFQLHLTQIISIEPGETDQQLHRDQMAFDFFPFPDDYHVQCNTMWALTDFTAENGATRIRP